MRPFRLLITCATCLAAAIASPALAASAQYTGPRFGYAVAAAGFRSYFVFDTASGEAVHGTLRLTSLTSGAKTILVRPVDVSTAATGGLQYGDGPAVGEGRWLKLAAPSVQLVGAGSASVPFTVRVPHNAQPGEHFLGIVAVDRHTFSRPVTGRGAIRLRLIPRLAMTVELRLPGPRMSQLRVGAARIEVAPSGASLAIVLANPGNRLIPTSSGSVTVSQANTALFSRGLDVAAFVPSTAITYQVPWEGTPVQGTYRVRGEIRPAGGPVIPFTRTVTFDRGKIVTYRQDTGRPAKDSGGTPVLLIVALAAAIVVATAFGVAYAQTRRQMRSGG